MKSNRNLFPFLLPIRCILFLLLFFLLSIFLNQPYTAISKWWTVIAIGCNLITIFILYLFCHRKKISFQRLIGYEKEKQKISSMILIILVAFLLGMGGLFLAGLICYGSIPYLDKTMVEPIPLWLAIIVLLILPLSTTLAEDGLYLGYGINCATQNKWIRSSLSAFFYALQHCFIPFLPDGKFILYRFLSFLPLTIMFSFWYQKKRNPLPFMLGHFLLNIATAVQILIMTIFPNLYASL